MATRGEVWWADVGERAAFVVLAEHADVVRAIRIVPSVVPHPASREIEVARELGVAGVVRVALPVPGRIRCQWVWDLSPADLVQRAGSLAPQLLAELEELLRQGAVE